MHSRTVRHEWWLPSWEQGRGHWGRMKRKEAAHAQSSWGPVLRADEEEGLGAVGSSILTQSRASECSCSRLSLPLLKDEDNFSSSHRGHSLLQIIQVCKLGRECETQWMITVFHINITNSVQFSSVALSCLTLCHPMNPACQVSLSITNSQSLPKPMSIVLVMPSNHLILCRLLLLLPSILPSIRVFSSESALRIRRPKYWSFSFNISPSNEHPGLISFRMDWLDLLAVQGTLKSLLQHDGSRASILWCSTFFIVQLSHPYMTAGKTIALTRQSFVGKVMSLLLNMLSRLVITFLPRSKCLLISWLQSPSAVIWSPEK